MFDNSGFLFWAKNKKYQRCILKFSSLPQEISVKATHRAYAQLGAILAIYNGLRMRTTF